MGYFEKQRLLEFDFFEQRRVFTFFVFFLLGMFALISHFDGVLFQNYINNLNLGHVNSEMLCETSLVFVSFVALVALERLFPSVRPHVALQMTGRNACEVALVTLVWLFSCVHPHHVLFQIASCNAGILAQCASVRLSPEWVLLCCFRWLDLVVV